MTFAEFERRIGVSASSLQRLEMGDQNITIDTLEQLVAKLKCRLSDIFPG
jgi:DNA-binding Xre family transcriptional regulator